jgi:hypothetical protein
MIQFCLTSVREGVPLPDPLRVPDPAAVLTPASTVEVIDSTVAPVREFVADRKPARRRVAVVTGAT